MNRNSLGFASSGSWAATERSEGEPGEPKRSGVAAQAGADSLLASRPDPEVVAKAKRRTYTAEYKLDILQEAEAAAATHGRYRSSPAPGRLVLVAAGNLAA